MRTQIVWAACLGMTLASCKTQQAADTTIEKVVRRPNAPAILVLLPNSKSARDTLAGIQNELADDFDILPRFVDDDVTASDVRKHHSEVKPQLVVLMNNPTLRAYRKFLAAVPDAAATPVVGGADFVSARGEPGNQRVLGRRL